MNVTRTGGTRTMRSDGHDGTTPAGLVECDAGAFWRTTGGKVRRGSPDLRLPMGLPCGHCRHAQSFGFRERSSPMGSAQLGELRRTLPWFTRALPSLPTTSSPQGCPMGSRRRDEPRRIMPTDARAKARPTARTTPQGLSYGPASCHVAKS